MSEEKLDLASNMGVLAPPKRRKGRPPKNLSIVPLVGEKTVVPNKRGRKRKNGEILWPAIDDTFVGQQVHGVLDGSFDAGYFLTVRVADSQTVLRGAVFEPSLSAPVSKSNDIAPTVRFIGRSELSLPPIPEHQHPDVAGAVVASCLVPPSCSRLSQNDYAKEGDGLASQIKTPGPENSSTEAMAATNPENCKESASPSQPSELEVQVKSEVLTTDAQPPATQPVA